MAHARDAYPAYPDAAAAPESGARERVLRAVSRHAPVTAARLAALLGISDTAVRRQLDALLDGGLVEVRDQIGPRRGRGRPARAYVVSDAGHHELTADYDHLAGEALAFLEETSGPAAVGSFAQARIARLEQRYAAHLAALPTSAERVEALVAALTREGFDASARPVGIPGSAAPRTGIQLCQGHCPVQAVAAQFPQFCDAETEAFSRLLGVHVQRLATLAHGDHVCTTFVPADTPAVTSDSEGTTR